MLVSYTDPNQNIYGAKWRTTTNFAHFQLSSALHPTTSPTSCRLPINEHVGKFGQSRRTIAVYLARSCFVHFASFKCESTRASLKWPAKFGKVSYFLVFTVIYPTKNSGICIIKSSNQVAKWPKLRGFLVCVKWRESESARLTSRDWGELFGKCEKGSKLSSTYNNRALFAVVLMEGEHILEGKSQMMSLLSTKIGSLSSVSMSRARASDRLKQGMFCYREFQYEDKLNIPRYENRFDILLIWS